MKDLLTEVAEGAVSQVPERLYRACRAVADNIAEFDAITDGELLDELDAALTAAFDIPNPVSHEGEA